MLIDPNGKHIQLNVESWNNNNIVNEFENRTNLQGYIDSTYKGSATKFTCSGTIYGNNIDSQIRYLESITFDDIIEVSLDINLEDCNSNNTPTENIDGYICIESFKTSQYSTNYRTYNLAGYYFSKNKFQLKTISSYFNMSAVVGSTSNGFSSHNQMIGASLTNDFWNNVGITITTAGGPSFILKPTELLDCSVVVEELEIGNNICRWQLLTKYNDAIVDVSYIYVNRGGFKLETNLQWDIYISNYNKFIFKKNRICITASSR